ncbi:MAG: hypothetical protein Q8N34_03210 [Gammaproteobacteria bacterium]|nr:hypothetical protein [Gammaproteobacteria bacterium]
MALTTFNVTARIFDQDGAPIEGAVITVRLTVTDRTASGTFTPTDQTFYTDDDGTVVMPLVPNSAGLNGTRYLISAVHPVSGALIYDEKPFTVLSADAYLDTLFGDSPVATEAYVASSLDTFQGYHADLLPLAADMAALAQIVAQITALASVDEDDLAVVAAMSASVTALAAITDDLQALADNSANITALAGQTEDLAALYAIAADITALAGAANGINALSMLAQEISALGNLTAEIAGVADISLEIVGVYQARVQIAVLGQIVDEIAALGPLAADIALLAENIEAIQNVTVALGAIQDEDFTANGIMVRTGLGLYGTITDNSGNWNAAFGWGNHASAGYVLSSAIGVTVQGYSAELAATTAAFTTTLKTKLDAIEAGATADMTAAEILAFLLTVDGAGSNLDADTIDGTQLSSIVTNYQAYADAAVASAVGMAPGALDTLEEIAASLGDDDDFAGTMIAALAGKQAFSTILTNFAALTVGANKLFYGNGTNTFGSTDFTAFARTILDDADGPAVRATIGAGTVSSVALTLPTGLSVSGSPVTTTGTIAVTFTAGYSIPTDASQGNWNTAFGWGNHGSAGYLLPSAIGVTIQGYSAVLAATTASFLTAHATKLGLISVTGGVDLDAINTRVASLDAAVILKGSWDASVGTFPGAGSAQAGESWIVSVGGTVGGTEFTANDRIIAITDNASTTVYAGNWHKADYTDQDVAVVINAATAKTTPVDADLVGLVDSAASNILKKLSWANIKAALKTYFDTLYLSSSAIGTTVQAYDVDTLKADVADVLTAGFANTDFNAGTKSSGTFTPDEALGNQQYATNGGAHTLAPPANSCSMTIHYTNNGSAGAITTSGFTVVDGDAFTTTNAHKFICFITKTNSQSVLTVKAMQ